MPGRDLPPVDLVLPERVDVSSVAEIRDALQLAITASPSGHVVVDVSLVQVVDAAGLGVLVTAHRTCARLGGRLVLADPPPRLLRILAVTRLHRVLHLDRMVTLPGRTSASA